MSETLLSPGVLARENDQSQITQGPVEVGAAIIGPAAKGPVEIPTLVTSFSEYTSTFGSTVESGSNVYSYLTSVSANNYFQNGGTSLLVTRVTSGSFTPAISTDISNGEASDDAIFATGSFTIAAAFSDGDETQVTISGTKYRFIASGNPVPEDDVDGNLYFFSTGSTAAGTATNLSAEMDAALDGTFNVAAVSDEIQISSSLAGATYNDIIFQTGSGTDFSTQVTIGGGDNGTSNAAFVLETISEGEIMNSDSTEGINNTLPSGSVDNIRWEIASANTSSGTFSLLIRRGNDSSKQKVVLESFNNLSLDPYASNYISKVIGDIDQNLRNEGTDYYIQESGSYSNASRYVRVKSVNTPTPNYFDNAGNAKAAFKDLIPVVGSGSFNSAVGSNIPTGRAANFYSAINNTDTQGLVGTDYDNAIALLSNTDDYKFNLISVPGLISNNAAHSSQITSLVNNSVSRGDSIAVIDLQSYGGSVSGAITQAAGFDNSYAATYWPWVQTVDPNTGQLQFVPASTMISGVYAFTDASSEPWFAPAGITRGGLGQVTRAERKLTAGQRDSLYEANVNPIATFPSQGVVVFGQKTLQKRASALDRINVRRLLISLKSYISQVSDNLVFEQNSIATRNNFLAQVNPYLESVQQRQGLYAFKVVMDDTNNTADVIDRNELLGQIFLQPTKTAEYIILDFNVLPTGATFPA